MRSNMRSAAGRPVVLTAPNPISRPGCAGPVGSSRAGRIWRCRPGRACSTSFSLSPSRSIAATCSPAFGGAGRQVVGQRPGERLDEDVVRSA